MDATTTQTRAPLARFNPAQPGAAGMKLAATGLLVLMAGIFAASRAFEHTYPWLSFVKAFAEAAMVGGLADWFAVTALFRHPLGLPIPHTAIIPRNKDRIGEALANFISENFLTPIRRRPADAEYRRCRGDRAIPANPGGRGHAHPRRRLAPDRGHFRKPRRRTPRRHRQRRGFLAHPQDGSLAASRPCSRIGDQRGPSRPDA